MEIELSKGFWEAVENIPELEVSPVLWFTSPASHVETCRAVTHALKSAPSAINVEDSAVHNIIGPLPCVGGAAVGFEYDVGTPDEVERFVKGVVDGLRSNWSGSIAVTHPSSQYDPSVQESGCIVCVPQDETLRSSIAQKLLRWLDQDGESSVGFSGVVDESCSIDSLVALLAASFEAVETDDSFGFFGKQVDGPAFECRITSGAKFLQVVLSGDFPKIDCDAVRALFETLAPEIRYAAVAGSSVITGALRVLEWSGTDLLSLGHEADVLPAPATTQIVTHQMADFLDSSDQWLTSHLESGHVLIYSDRESCWSTVDASLEQNSPFKGHTVLPSFDHLVGREFDALNGKPLEVDGWT